MKTKKEIEQQIANGEKFQERCIELGNLKSKTNLSERG